MNVKTCQCTGMYAPVCFGWQPSPTAEVVLSYSVFSHPIRRLVSQFRRHANKERTPYFIFSYVMRGEKKKPNPTTKHVTDDFGGEI